MLAMRALVLLRLLASVSAEQSSWYSQYHLPSKRHFPNSTAVRFNPEPSPEQSHESETWVQTSTMRVPPSDRVVISTDISPSVHTAVNDQTPLIPEPAPPVSATSGLEVPLDVPSVELSSPTELPRPQPSRAPITSFQPPVEGPSPSEETRAADHDTEDAADAGPPETAPVSAPSTTAPGQTVDAEPSIHTEPSTIGLGDTVHSEGTDPSPLPLLPLSSPVSPHSEAESTTGDEVAAQTTLPSSEARRPETRTLAAETEPSAQTPTGPRRTSPSETSENPWQETDRPAPAGTEKKSALSEPPFTSNEFPEVAVVGQFEGPTGSATSGSDSTPAAIDTKHRTKDDSTDRTMDRLTSATRDSSRPSRGGPVTITRTDGGQGHDKSDDRPGSATSAHHDSLGNDALDSGDGPEPSLKQKAANAGIVIGAAGGAAILGVSVFVFSRRYRQRRLLYNQVGSTSSSQSSLEIRCAGLGGPQASSSLPGTIPLGRHQ